MLTVPTLAKPNFLDCGVLEPTWLRLKKEFCDDKKLIRLKSLNKAAGMPQAPNAKLRKKNSNDEVTGLHLYFLLFFPAYSINNNIGS